MKRMIFAGLSLSVLLSGCATEEYVLQKTTPLSEKLGMLETRVLTLEGKVNQLAGRDSLSMDDRKALYDAREMSQKALDEVGNLASDMKQLNTVVSKAEAAVKRAEAAAEKAGQSEKKAKKAFELEQKK